MRPGLDPRPGHGPAGSLDAGWLLVDPPQPSGIDPGPGQMATNEAEKAADIKVVDFRMIGATGRVYLAGTEADVRQAADAAQDALARSAT